MKTKFFVAAAIAVLLLNTIVSSGAPTRRARAKKPQTMRLVSLLPASDVVMALDSDGFFNEALPKLLAANQPILAEVLAKILEIETSTGIRFKEFDQIVVGIGSKQVTAVETDYEPVAIATGDINAAALVSIARLASNGAYREEKIGDKTVYLFLSKDAQPKKPTSKVTTFVAKAFGSLTKEVAVSALDDNTIVFGSLARVRETLEAKSRVKADISISLPINERAVLTFAARTSAAMFALMPLNTGDFGGTIDSVDLMAGSIEVAPAGVRLQVLAKTKRPEEARRLGNTIEGLRSIGKAVFSNSRRVDQRAYGRMLNSVKVNSKGKALSFDLFVPQVDIDLLIGGMK